jgi:hypothetical protein
LLRLPSAGLRISCTRYPRNPKPEGLRRPTPAGPEKAIFSLRRQVLIEAQWFLGRAAGSAQSRKSLTPFFLDSSQKPDSSKQTPIPKERSYPLVDYDIPSKSVVKTTIKPLSVIDFSSRHLVSRCENPALLVQRCNAVMGFGERICFHDTKRLVAIPVVGNP